MPTPTPSPRRRSTDREQRELDLLAAAEEAFVTHGYHSASMDLIATLAGVSKPIVYQYFAGKLELYQTLIERRSEVLLQRLATVLDSTTGTQARIAGCFAEFLRYVEEEDRSFLLLSDSGDRNGPPLADGQSGLQLAFTDFVAPLISASSGRSTEEGRLIGCALVAMCTNVALEWLKGGKETPREELATDLADVAWNGLQRRLGSTS